MNKDIDVFDKEMTEAEIKRESELIESVTTGLKMADAGLRSVALALQEVQENNLWRAYRSFKDWATDHFALTFKSVQNYLLAAGPMEAMCRVEGDSCEPKITHAMILAKVNEEDQEDAWREIIEANPDPTGKDITKKLRELAENGDIQFKPRQRVTDNVKGNNFHKRVVSEWLDMQDDERIDTLVKIFELEPLAQLRVIEALVQERIQFLENEK